MDSAFETIVLGKEGNIAHLVLNRPRVVNAYNIQMRDEIWQALEYLRDDPVVEVVILRGNGEKGFCAGADITEFGTAPSQVIARQARFERGVWELWLSIPKIFIAAMHGYVLGSGIEMACLCDIRIAADDASFGMPEAALGMIPAAGGSQTIPRTTGIGPALHLLMTAQRINAQEAHRIGLVHKVVPKERLLEETTALAQEILACNPSSVRKAKEAISKGMDMTVSQALELEERLAIQLMYEKARHK